MILSEQQEQLLRNLVKDGQIEEANKLAKEMLIVKHFNLDAENFEEDEDYIYTMDSDYEWIKVVKTYLKSSIEIFPLNEDGEADGFSDFDTFGFLGKDNKLYDKRFCEIPLKDFKKQYGVTKKQLITTDFEKDYLYTKTNECIELANDLEIYFCR